MSIHPKLTELYSATNNQLLQQHAELIQRLIPLSVKEYYASLLSTPETAKFLTNELVENHLQVELTKWLQSVLSAKQEDEIEDTYQQQQFIGQVHARINVDMSLVSEAMIVLKNSLHQGLLEHNSTDKQLILLVHNILDIALININQVYFTNHSQIEHNSHILRTNLASMDFALEIEQMRNELNEWFMNGLLKQSLTPINETEFALWVKHKLSLVVAPENGYTEIELLLHRIAKLSTETQLDSQLPSLTQTIKDMSWHLSEQSKRLVSDQEKKDPLTKLFNRRFLDSIMLQATSHAQLMEDTFSVVMLDIDHFKQINDEYGHDIGDVVLSTFAETIDHNIRASDFAFRYGGEEFLILLSECSAPKARQIIQKIAQSLQSIHFLEEQQNRFQVTFSAGIAEFDGQPDYQHTLKKADLALYRSKDSGRNQITVF